METRGATDDSAYSLSTFVALYRGRKYLAGQISAREIKYVGYSTVAFYEERSTGGTIPREGAGRISNNSYMLRVRAKRRRVKSRRRRR